MWQRTDVMAFRAGLADSIRLLFCRTSGRAFKTCSSTVQSHSYKDGEQHTQSNRDKVGDKQ